jgi:hypothetical protein
MLYTVNTIFDGLHVFHATNKQSHGCLPQCPNNSSSLSRSPARLMPFASTSDSDESENLTVLFATRTRT